MNQFFKQEKESMFGVPKKDGSGKGIRLNKGRGGCSMNKQNTKDLMKTAVTLPLVAGGILIGTKLIGEISE